MTPGCIGGLPTIAGRIGAIPIGPMGAIEPIDIGARGTPPDAMGIIGGRMLIGIRGGRTPGGGRIIMGAGTGTSSPRAS